MNDIKVVTICGSMRFAEEMKKVAWNLELNNRWAVIQCVYGGLESEHSSEDWEALEVCHLKKIDISDAIYVVNVNGYIGNHTRQEIEYATKLGKEVIYHVQEHQMKLNTNPFELIESEEKQIEYRLNDEKRQLLRVGDIITFTKLPDEDKKLSVVITDLKKYKTLLEMYDASFDHYLHNYYSNPQAVVDATDYYSDEEVEKHGCLAIHIKKLQKTI